MYDKANKKLMINKCLKIITDNCFAILILNCTLYMNGYTCPSTNKEITRL